MGIMRERARAVNAILAITGRPGDGTSVMVTWQRTEEISI
jgi:nitrate/nitrite-specific signal transduction histidine kinase